ncbi:hypothetical protein LTR40_012083 [Exophiala xenobiotica]|nr:hypothetical protein LTS06_012526 [Exophiala xenobiotica]KAK5276075.1 hypothetical protein LTR40_012083 [Exophiala xenobiotica]
MIQQLAVWAQISGSDTRTSSHEDYFDVVARRKSAFLLQILDMCHHAAVYPTHGQLDQAFWGSCLGINGRLRRVSPADPEPNVLDHVDYIQVPPDFYCEIGLTFSLFTAGWTAADESDCRDYVRDRLDHIQGWTRFKHTARARVLLEYLWSAGRTAWQTVLQEWDWKISLA